MSNRRPFTHVSASQVTAFLNCNRVWHFGWVQGFKSPTTPAMERGTKIHEVLEKYLKTGKIEKETEERWLGYERYAEVCKHVLPDPKDESLIIEQEISFETRELLWRGFVDLGFHIEMPNIWDHKSTSDFRYNKTPAELSNNVQLVSYAKWAYEKLDYDGPICLAHNYLKSYPETRKLPKKPQHDTVKTVVEKEHVDNVWTEVEDTLEQMKEVALVENVQDVEPNISACDMYGGCPHRARCGIAATDIRSLFNMEKKKEKEQKEMANRFTNRLKNKKKSKQEEVEEEEIDEEELEDEEEEEEKPKRRRKKAAPKKRRTTRTRKKAQEEDGEEEDEDEEEEEEKPKRRRGRPKKKAVEEEEDEDEEEEEKPKRRRGRPRKAKGVLPEDAPSRKNDDSDEDEEEEEKPAPKKRRGRPKGSKNKKVSTGNMTIYVDCAPNKGDMNYTLFEDWYAPVIETLNEIAEEQGKEDYRLLSFGEEKALVTKAIKEMSDELPEHLVVNTGSPGAKDALAGLIPYAARVIRATR